jgi:hypothetical protein
MRNSAPMIVTAELDRADQSWAEALRRVHFPPDRNKVPAHISLFHHLPPSLKPELRALLAEAAKAPKPAVRIEGVRSLGRGVAIDIACPALLELRAEIADRCAPHLIPQDRHTPRLHITIQNKVTPAVAADTLAILKESVALRPTVIAALNLWHYEDGPWSPIARYAFRG